MVGSNGFGDADGPDEPPTFQYDPEAECDLGTAVTMAVAAVTGAQQTVVGRSLADGVDTDGLDRLFRPNLDDRSSTAERVALRVEGCVVTVTSDGRITVQP